MPRAELPCGSTAWEIRERKPEQTSFLYHGGYQARPSELAGGNMQGKVEQGGYDKDLRFDSSSSHGVLPELPSGKPIERTWKIPANAPLGSHRQSLEIQNESFNHETHRTTTEQPQRQVYNHDYRNLPELSAGSAYSFDHERAAEGPQDFALSHCQAPTRMYIGNEDSYAGPRLSWDATNQSMHDRQPIIELSADNTDNREVIDYSQLEIAELFSESELRLPYVASSDTTEHSSGASQPGSGSQSSLRRNLYDAGHRLWKINTNQLSSDTAKMGFPSQSGSNTQLRLAEPREPDLILPLPQQVGEIRFHQGRPLKAKNPAIAKRGLSIRRSRLNAALPYLPSYSVGPECHSLIRPNAPSIPQTKPITSKSKAPWLPRKLRISPASYRARSTTARNTTQKLVEEYTSDQKLSMDKHHDHPIKTDRYSIADFGQSLYSTPSGTSQPGQFTSMPHGSPSTGISPSSAGLSATSGRSGWSSGFMNTQDTPISIISPICDSLRSPITTGISERMFRCASHLLW
ncbi:hypothetical protein MMC18_008292 [Xylographa bjoerkii]|nr:hypothetical protein [Xylographa bjoerkii]